MALTEKDSLGVWAHHFASDPTGTMNQAYHFLQQKGLLDISTLWRQLYDDKAGVDVFRWYNIAIYLIGAIAFYVALNRVSWRSITMRKIGDYLLPPDVRNKKSFCVDAQWLLLRLLKIDLLIVNIIAVIFFLKIIPSVISALHLHSMPGLEQISHGISALPTGLRIAAIFVLGYLGHEFGYYWAHRLMHSSKTLWSFHKVHHYSRQLNMMVNARFHPVDTLTAATFSNAFMVLFICIFTDFQLTQGDGHAALFALAQNYYWPVLLVVVTTCMGRFGHSHIPLSLGPVLNRVFVTPAVHIVHHSRTVFDTNFGDTLSVWDVIFGTYYVHDYREPVELGIPEFEDDHYRNVFHALIEPFRDAWGGLAVDAQRLRGLGSRLLGRRRQDGHNAALPPA